MRVRPKGATQLRAMTETAPTTSDDMLHLAVHGWCVLDNVIPEAQVEGVLQSVTRTVESSEYLEDRNFLAHNADFVRYVANGRILALLRELWGRFYRDWPFGTVGAFLPGSLDNPPHPAVGNQPRADTYRLAFWHGLAAPKRRHQSAVPRYLSGTDDRLDALAAHAGHRGHHSCVGEPPISCRPVRRRPGRPRYTARDGDARALEGGQRPGVR